MLNIGNPQKGLNENRNGDARPKAPSPLNDIKIYARFVFRSQTEFDRSVDHALAQLIVYLASLRQSRLQRNRLHASVYGLASDGYGFIFVKISHDGTVMLSRRFDILREGSRMLDVYPGDYSEQDPGEKER